MAGHRSTTSRWSPSNTHDFDRGNGPTFQLGKLPHVSRSSQTRARPNHTLARCASCFRFFYTVAGFNISNKMSAGRRGVRILVQFRSPLFVAGMLPCFPSAPLRRRLRDENNSTTEGQETVPYRSHRGSPRRGRTRWLAVNMSRCLRHRRSSFLGIAVAGERYHNCGGLGGNRWRNKRLVRSSRLRVQLYDITAPGRPSSSTTFR